MLQLQHDDYKVGWICALPKEQTAAIAMLDGRHANLPKPPTDPNAYTLGAIGDHNIVIACLPKGKYGTVSASVVASNMASTFSAIRFGLMVGIGGGIPPKVRLGDVVVSVPVDQYPGVVQWDLGKAEEGGMFRRTGALNNPPTSLLTVLTKLESEHELMGPGFPQYLEDLATKFPRLASKYARPKDIEDMLFERNYAHISNSQDIGRDDGCDSCDKNRLVNRDPRDAQVHYGPIASGNQLIKDAIFRDSLIETLGGNILCVEMEAAGLMDNFPCIVIRGICDYADSHKNKIWQEHAAAVAAAFAKELLGYATVVDIAQEDAIKNTISHINHTVDAIKEDTMCTNELLNKKEDFEIMKWLSDIHYGTQQSDNLRKWHPKTGQWFLGSEEYQKWLGAKGKTLYCSGIPGAGKTTMAAAAINDISRRILADRNFGLAYVYFTFSQQREQTIEHILASLLMQLLRRRTSIPPQIRKLHDLHKAHGTRLSRNDLFDCLQLVVSEYEQVFIVLDALDECGTIDQCRMHVLHDILKLQDETDVNILATSRKHEDIESKICHQDTLVRKIEAPEADMELVLSDQMESHDQELFIKSFREYIASKLSAIANGMFLLAQLHLNALIAMPTRGKIKRALEELASEKVGLYDVYELAMKRIENQGHEINELAKATLLWIVHARRQLSAGELQEALSVIPNADAIDEDDIPPIRTLQSICAGLVTIDTGSNKVRLIHYTTQQYLERTRKKWFPDAQRHITKACLSYLSFPIFRKAHFLVQNPARRCQNCPFYGYAAYEWVNHARASPAMLEVIEFLGEFEKTRWFLPWHHLSCRPFLDSRAAHKTTRTGLMLALHVVIHFGLDYAAKALLDKIDDHEDHVCDPTVIGHAVKHERKELIKLLCNIPGMDVNGKDEWLMTPLGLATGKGNAEIVQLLLETGKVDVNVRNGQSPDWTPLAFATSRGNTQVVHLLLDTGEVDINERNEANQTTLLWLMRAGYGNKIKTLIETGRIDINSKDKAGRTPLAIAADTGHAEMVGFLLSTGKVDINSKDNAGQTPLVSAAKRGHNHVVMMLAETGKASINCRHLAGQMLVFAAKNGHEQIIQSLLETSKIDINSKDRAGLTLLALAAGGGHKKVVKTLLAIDGVDINSKDPIGQTPLALAAEGGHEKIIQLLVDTGKVKINSRDGFGRTPLATAASRGHDKVVEILIKADNIDVDGKDINGSTPLALAAECGSLRAVELLIETGKVNKSSKNWLGLTPQAQAAKKGHAAVAQLLGGLERLLM